MPMAILDHKFDHIKFSPKSQSAELFWKILVIDDEKTVHDTMVIALKGLSFKGTDHHPGWKGLSGSKESYKGSKPKPGLW